MKLMMIYRLFLFLLIAVLPISVQAETTTAKQAYIVDFETGQTLMSKNADQKMPTSSMSKVMTMYMVFDAIKDGTIDMDTKFKVSEKAWAKGGSKTFVDLGSEIKVQDLAKGVIIQSGNDATIVLAEGLAGSEERFANNMTDKARELGMKNSNFVNASGWPDDNHYSTAEDLAIMSKAMIKNFPEYFKFFSEKEFTYNNIKQQNRNPLLYRDIGADGLKTGHTEAGGYGLIGTAKRDDRRVVMVLNGMESEKVRADESARLINWALNNFVNEELLKQSAVIDTAAVVYGESDTVSLQIKEPVKLTVPRSERDNITYKIEYKSPLIAPVQAGQEVGTITVNIPTMDKKTYPIYTAGNVAEVGFFKKTLGKFKQTVLGQ
jgi:D-alanyl-D-alanine carboxypeptidase (penicillin-binding protein 5/6)